VKLISTALQDHIGQECTTLARCWKIVRRDGRTFYFTSFDSDLLFEGDTYIAAYGFSSTAVDSKADMTTDNQEVLGVFDDDSITLEDLRAGLFDQAAVFVFLVNWNDLTQGQLRLRRGTFGECQATPQGFFKVELRGMSQLLQQYVMDLYGPACRADLGDRKCKFDLATVTCVGSISSVTDSTNVQVEFSTVAGSTSIPTWFQHGVMTFTSGDNTGHAIEVKSWTPASSEIEFYVSPGYPLDVGVGFTLTPGCDKTLATCRDTFHNLVNKQSEDYLPGNDSTFSYPGANG
jgi:uncharacterized phage protein (TIGR02218 family)